MRACVFSCVGPSKGHGVGLQDVIRGGVGSGNRLHGKAKRSAFKSIEHVVRGVQAFQHCWLGVAQARRSEGGQPLLDLYRIVGAQRHVAHQIHRAGTVYRCYLGKTGGVLVRGGLNCRDESGETRPRP